MLDCAAPCRAGAVGRAGFFAAGFAVVATFSPANISLVFCSNRRRAKHVFPNFISIVYSALLLAKRRIIF